MYYKTFEMKIQKAKRRTRRTRWKAKKKLALTVNPSNAATVKKKAGGSAICLRPTEAQAPSNSNRFLLENFYQNQNLSYDEKNGKVSPKSSPLSFVSAPDDDAPNDVYDRDHDLSNNVNFAASATPSSPAAHNLLLLHSDSIDSEYVSSTQDREHTIELWSRDFNSELSKSIDEEEKGGEQSLLGLSRDRLESEIRHLRWRVDRLESDLESDDLTTRKGPEEELGKELQMLTEQNRLLKLENQRLKSGLKRCDSATHHTTPHHT